MFDKARELKKSGPETFLAITRSTGSSSHLSEGTTTQNSFLSEDDPRHPYQWPKLKKWIHVIIFSVIEFVTPLASMMFAPVVPQVAADIANNNITRTTLAVSIYVLGFIVGPLIFGPLSQLYGRMVIYRTTVAIYVVMSAGCALSTSIDMLTVFRFFGGCLGAAPIVIGGAAVADMYPALHRGRPMAVYSVGPFLGLTSGPIFGGLINYYCGWRWIFWTLSIAAGVLSFCTFAVLRETHLPTISSHLAKPRRNLWQYISAPSKPRRPARPERLPFRNHLRTVLLPAFWSPIRITFSSPQLFLLFVSNAVFTGIMNILFTTLGATYQSHYHFTTRFAGLAYIGIGTGGVIASVVLSKFSDRLVHFMSQRLSNLPYQHLERYRLPPVIIGDLLVSAGLVWYGWAVQSHSAWIVPLLGTFLFGLGMLSIQAGFPTYLVHAYSDQAGAVLSASIITRSIGGSTLTLAGPSLNKKLGYGWASTVLAFINLLFLLPAILLYRRPPTRTDNRRQTERPEMEPDAEKSECHAITQPEEEPLLKITISSGGQSFSALIDTRAEISILTKAVPAKLLLRKGGLDEGIDRASGDKTGDATPGGLLYELTYSAPHSQVPFVDSFVVVDSDVDVNYDVLLGRDWIMKHRPVIDWRLGSITGFEGQLRAPSQAPHTHTNPDHIDVIAP